MKYKNTFSLKKGKHEGGLLIYIMAVMQFGLFSFSTHHTIILQDITPMSN